MRLTSSDLLLAGWHNVCDESGSWWVHPQHDFLLPLKKAAWVENSWRRFGTQSNDEQPK